MALETDDPLETLLQEARQVDLGVPIYIASPTEDPTKAQWYDAYLPGTFHFFPRVTNRLELFNERFKARFGEEPTSPSVAPAYDAANLVIGTFRSGARTGPEIRKY